MKNPRTTVGWKGLINDPHLDGSLDIASGLVQGRALLLEIAEMGVAPATEFLDPIVPQFLGDLVAWAAIGARTTESQTHREMASGLSMPVGFKNGTDGSFDVAISAMIASGAPHAFLGIDPQGHVGMVQSKGNPDTHVVLRGGASGPNYEAGAIADAIAQLTKAGQAPRVLVDCNHGNSGKDHNHQPNVFRNVAAQIAEGQDKILGMMVESHWSAGPKSSADPSNH